MGEFSVEGPELKKLVARGKSQPVPFAFAENNAEEDPKKKPDKKDDKKAAKKDEKKADFVLSMHREKDVDVLRRATKEESGSTKVAAGTFVVVQKDMRCTCDRLIPGMAKKLKKHLKTNKVSLNVVIMDASGNILESDVEELPPDPEFDAMGGEDGVIPDAPPQPGTNPTAEVKPTVTPPTPGPVTDPDAKKPETTPDPRLAKLREVVQTLAGRVGALDPGQARDAAAAALKLAAQSIAQNDVEAGMTAIRRAQELLVAATSAGVTGSDADSGDEKKWTDTAAKLGPLVEGLLKAGKGDTSALRAVWGFATEKADGKDFAGALKALPKLVELVKAAQAATKTEAEGQIPANVVAYTQSRLGWINTRKLLRDELARLQAAIIAACEGSEEFPDIRADSDALFAYLNGLDERLEKVLEALTVAADGAAREKLKQEAAGIVSEYRAELDTDFFKDVDTANGFTNVAVRSSAIASLAEVEKALAA